MDTYFMYKHLSDMGHYGSRLTRVHLLLDETGSSLSLYPLECSQFQRTDGTNKQTSFVR